MLPMQTNNYKRLYEPGKKPMNPHELRMVSTPPPRDHILCSLLNFIYCNPCCLGLIALYYSIRARDRKMLGDPEAAQEYGSKARCLNIAAFCMGMITLLVFIVILCILFSTVKMHEEMEKKQNHGLKENALLGH